MNDDLFFHEMISSVDWSSFPFNGQLKRSRKVRMVIESILPNIIIETGTYRGVTTEFLCSVSKVPIISIEINREFFDGAMQKFSRSGTLERIELIHGDSVTCLKTVVKRDNFHKNALFVYLDAHWNEALPVYDELSIFSGWNPECVILVDDFKVEKYPMYGFDQYKDIEISSKNLPELKGFRLFVPSESHLYETGSRRGSGYFLNERAISKLPTEFFQNLEEVIL